MDLDEFDDDDFDDLGENDLVELENNAIQLTQVKHEPAGFVDDGDFDMEDAQLIDTTKTMPSLLQNTLPPATTGDSQLMARIEELLRENKALRQDLTAKAGEISIVRSKHDRAVKDHERELDAIRHLHEETTAKHQRELEASRNSERKAATELEFTKRDLFDEAERARSMKKARQAPPAEQSTPKKLKKQMIRDGFDDDDLQIISPTKFQGRRSTHGTPTKTGKRKRKGPDSPITAALEVITEPVTESHEILLVSQSDGRFEFLQTVGLALEGFTSSFFPSNKDCLAALLVARLASMPTKQTDLEFATDFCKIVMDLWQRCLEEAYYEPLPEVIALLSCCLEMKTLSVSPLIIDLLLPLCQSTGDLVAIPRFQHKQTDHLRGTLSFCLQIMHLAAISCLVDVSNIAHFWKLVRPDFVFILLSPQQAVEDFCLMLELLQTSILRESIGPHLSDAVKQQEQAGYLIDRVTMSFFWTPGEPGDHDKASQMHLKSLRTLFAFCQSNWGSEAVAKHSYAIGRLVRLLSDEMDSLYDFGVNHQTSSQIINLAVRLLRHLVTTHEKDANLQRKLSAVQGGVQKYLICLARLSFSEDDLVMEAGIEAEVAECAHELLELIVTPEEGDAIHAAFTVAI